ncbi:hypothetical protein AVEN_7003-1 [Araneus ventricosus]|uniref:Uncharacterized protein n=1 Tax=Araneus ventricosus TaxID=182803 RepID=A0A4Y2JLU9_ARAVE|nr:hypothetical protein AVEN_7003-1 [Araneus ventricosus]
MQSTVSFSNTPTIKLPEIPLPKFSGRYEEWNNFKLQFNNLITSNSQLSQEQKLHYLNSSLTGPAKDLQSIDDTFDSLFKALTDKFENKMLLVELHINEILEAGKLTTESAKDLRNLTDNIKKSIRGLKVLEYNRNNLSDVLILNIVISKLSKQSRQYYESSLSSNEVPKLDDLISFLEKRAQILENINKNATVKPKPFRDRYGKPKTFFVKPNKVERPCAMSLVKNVVVVTTRYCIETVIQSNAISQMQYLSKKAATSQELNPNAGEFRSNVSPQDNIGHFFSCIDKTNKCTVLPTVKVWVLNHFNGSFLQARGILYSGSGQDLMTTDFANRLGFPQEKTNFAVSGLGGNGTKVKSRLRATIQNGSGFYRTSLDFLVVPKITDFLTIVTYNLENVTIPDNLADPQFATPGKIDILIGAQSFFDIIKNDQIRLPNSGLVFRNTIFGYVASGAVNLSTPVQYCGFISQVKSIDDCLRKFWEVETINEPAKMLSEEEEFCEHHYKTTHKRDETGRYIVQMPVKDIEKLGESKTMAIKRLDQLWKRLSSDEAMKIL